MYRSIVHNCALFLKENDRTSYAAWTLIPKNIATLISSKFQVFGGVGSGVSVGVLVYVVTFYQKVKSNCYNSS